MLSLLRTNQTLASFIILPYLILLHLPGFIFAQDWTPPSYGILTQGLYGLVGTRGWLIHILVILVLFIEGFLANLLVLKHRLGREYNLYAGLFLVLVASSIPEFLVPSSMHFANLFLLLGISEFLNTYRKGDCADNIFNAGLWISIASCFHFSYIILVLLGLFGLNLMRALKLNEILIYLSGFLVPYILIATYMFWIDKLDVFYFQHILQNVQIFRIDVITDVFSYFKVGWFLALTLISFFSYSLYTNRMKMQEQKKVSILYWVLILTLLVVIGGTGPHLEHFLVLAVPLGIFISFNFATLNSGVGETIHAFILLAVLFLQYKDLMF